MSRHQVAQILSIATVAALRGATSLVAIGEVSGSLPDEVLERLGYFFLPSKGRLLAPEESTIRRVLHEFDGDSLDCFVSSWMREQVAAGRLSPEEAPEVSLKTMIEEDPASDDEDDEDEQSPVLPAVAIDDKTLRGARLEDGRKVHLLSVLELESGATIAQANVDIKTNETKVSGPMLRDLDLEGVVVTADALHTYREFAAFLRTEKSAHYVLRTTNPRSRL